MLVLDILDGVYFFVLLITEIILNPEYSRYRRGESKDYVLYGIEYVKRYYDTFDGFVIALLVICVILYVISIIVTHKYKGEYYGFKVILYIAFITFYLWHFDSAAATIFSIGAAVILYFVNKFYYEVRQQLSQQ